jgi:hypothetical protein
MAWTVHGSWPRIEQASQSFLFWTDWTLGEFTLNEVSPPLITVMVSGEMRDYYKSQCFLPLRNQELFPHPHLSFRIARPVQTF